MQSKMVKEIKEVDEKDILANLVESLDEECLVLYNAIQNWDHEASGLGEAYRRKTPIKHIAKQLGWPTQRAYIVRDRLKMAYIVSISL